MLIAWTVFAVTVGNCSRNNADEPEWIRFNHEGDTIDVDVRPGDLGLMVEQDLTSSTGEAVVGTVSVEPGAGPVGTEHLVVVNILDAFEERVQRVDLVATSDTRGEQEFSMSQDSADLGIWVFDLTSYGVDGEERVDVFELALWEVSTVELPEEDPE